MQRCIGTPVKKTVGASVGLIANVEIDADADKIPLSEEAGDDVPD
jgi:hypothetical protein